MSDKTASDPSKPAKPTRDQRLKLALKANMARRKAQAQARASAPQVPAPGGAIDATGPEMTDRNNTNDKR